MTDKILVINLGSTSTKIAVFTEKETIWEKSIKHSTKDIERFRQIIEQIDWRQGLILNELAEEGFVLDDFVAISARGGVALDPIPGGTYLIDQSMIEDLYNCKNGEHASNLAGIIAYNLATKNDILAFIVDPVAVDEFEDVARFSGLPELPRRCQSHALNIKAIARKMADKLGRKLTEVNLIGVHLGGGISIAALKRGKIVDVNNASQNGPYSPDRVGSLPPIDLIEYLIKTELTEKTVRKKLINKGGLIAYLGTNDGQEIERMIDRGDNEASLVYEGMIYQIVKEIGKMAVVLKGKVDAVFITGGLANSCFIVNKIKEKVDFIGPLMVYPGAEEIKHLAEGVFRVLRGEEIVKIYTKEKIRTGGEWC